MMTYPETINYLYQRLPMFQRVGAAAFKKDLGNTLALLEILGNPHRSFSSIHVGGTNGKGSVTHLLGAALQAGGFRTGMYVSPHYKDFRERMKIDGQYIPKRFVVDFVARMQGPIEEIQPSFFELTVAMAFEWFAQSQVDMAVVEVGMGGRLDSTNVLLPELAVITNISFDHQQYLGDTLPLIAGEKAGIIKAGIPVVIGETQEETAPVFRQKAQEVGAQLVFADQLFQVSPLNIEWKHTHYRVHRKHQPYHPGMAIALHGPYQQLNIQTALAALEVWQQHNPHRSLPFEAIEQGWNNLPQLTRFIGRWQILQENPTLLIDSAHNEAGIKMLMRGVEAIPHRQLHVVLGVVNDKDLGKVLPLFPTSARYYFAKANIPRGLEAAALQETAKKYNLHGKTYVSVKQALRAAQRAAQAEDLILVGGSIFTVAEVI